MSIVIQQNRLHHNSLQFSEVVSSCQSLGRLQLWVNFQVPHKNPELNGQVDHDPPVCQVMLNPGETHMM